MKCKNMQEKEKINLKLQNKKKVQKLKEKGITLIALVVTIIILLILVGVTISQITGENGLIRKAKEAVERYKNASEEEQIQLGELEKRVVDLEKENTSLKGATRKRIDLGTERTIDVKTKLQSLGYDSTLYEKLTEENFAVEVSLIWTGGKAYSDNKASRDLWDDLTQEGASPSYSYKNGILNRL